ncbi:hypothetical protein D7X33_51660 [Butyricicoccus sp. 1XD8-22]|nr:hypothetical protein D7X33_51660 [Butyricicoccus sp. 1XD8-22]
MQSLLPNTGIAAIVYQAVYADTAGAISFISCREAENGLDGGAQKIFTKVCKGKVNRKFEKN